MDFSDLLGFAGVPGLQPAADALFQFYTAIENIKVYNDQCQKLKNQSMALLFTLRDNGSKLVGTDYIEAVDEAEQAIERISKKARVWASWSKAKSLIRQSEIRQGLDDLSSDLAHCAMRFNMTFHMESLNKQREMSMLLRSNHAEMQERLDRLLEKTQDIPTLIKQPESNIMSEMLHIQEVLRSDIAKPEVQHNLQQRLLSIHRRTELLPPMIDLTGEVRRIGNDPVNVSGGHSDVYLGKWLGDEKVALKLTRGINQTPKAQKRFIKEVDIWRQLQHKNVARLYGVATIGNHVYTVSPWMEHLDALHYIENNPTTDRLKILYEVATGLEFLHKHGVVHGDLRAANILISEAQIACITDFGLSVLLEEESQPSTAGESQGNSRWMAPELINPESIGLSSVKPGVHTDVWSYGMLCLEILTGERPYNRKRIPAAITDIINGVLPIRPPPEVTRRGLSDDLWELMRQCWHQVPRLRPAVTDIVRKMKLYQSKRSFSQSSLSPSGSRLMTQGYGSISGTSQINPPNSNGTPPSRLSPLPIAGQSRMVITDESPFSTTPPAGTSDIILSTSYSSSSSNVRPSTAESNSSELGKNYSTAVSYSTTPSNRAPLLPHIKSASFSAGISQTKNITRVSRPATAGAAEPTFPRLGHIGESHREEVDDGFNEIMAYLRSGFGDSNELPVVQMELMTSPPSSLGVLYSKQNNYNPNLLPSVFAPSESSSSYSDDIGSPSTSSLPGDTRRSSGALAITPVVDPQERNLSEITYGKDGMVARGSLLSLVNRLIVDSSEFRRDIIQYREIFFASYQAFTNAKEVFRLLMERFEAVSSPVHAGTKFAIVSLLDLWLRGQRIQTKDIPLLKQMRSFASSIDPMMTAPTIVTSAQRLMALIDTQMSEFIASPKSPITPSSSIPSTRLSGRPPDMSPSALASVLTKLENERFQKIIPSDFIGWLKNLRDNNGISTFITENNKLSYWVQKSILKPDLQAHRVENLNFFLHVTDECRKRRNFSSACALFVGIASPSVTSLKRTGDLEKSSAKLFAAMEKLLSSEGNFQNYRKSLTSSKDPYLPWLRVHLHDIKAVHESGKTYLTENNRDDIINFELYCDIYQRIQKLLGHGSEPVTTSHTDSTSSHMQAFVESQLHSLVVNETLLEWLRRRAAKLSQEELNDYDTHKQELRAAGFIRQSK